MPKIYDNNRVLEWLYRENGKCNGKYNGNYYDIGFNGGPFRSQ